MQRNAVTKDVLCFNMFVEICAYEFAHVVLFFAWTGYFALILIINVRFPSVHAGMLRLYTHLNFSF